MDNQAQIILAGIGVACSLGGILLVRSWRQHQDQKLIRQRLALLLTNEENAVDRHLLESAPEEFWLTKDESRFPFVTEVCRFIDRSGLNVSHSQFFNLMLVLFALPIAVSFLFAPDGMLIAAIAGLLLSALPVLYIYMVSEKRRTKFVEQLPDGIELMISVLRSGLSVPQAVKSVSEEMPAPCGTEFNEIVQRMNLGQSLPDALQAAVERYDLFELDLIRRATGIQLEVGGSLADLLEKTNDTLRQRLSLKRKIRVHTAQSRLSGYIIAALPFVLAIAFQIINPQYLTPLFTTNIGKVFVAMALLFQIAGVIAINKLASFRV